MKPTTTDSLIVLANDRCGGMSTAFLVDISQRGVRIRPTAKDAVGPNAFSWDIELLDCEVPQANLLGELGNGHQILSTAQMNARLGISAGTLGVMADCLESIAAFTSDRIKRAEGPSAREAVERYVARTATDLEAARGLVYAAAELKVDYDRRPTSEHLASETNTLVREANYFVNQSIERMLSGAESIRVADESLLQCLPARHRLMSRPSEVFEEADRELEVRIAAYYLDSDAPVKSKESV
jgi:alkylation response protein AidB-like acyl-CoA dehydrogenase